MSYTLNLLDHYAGVRSRLYGAKVVMALAAPAAVEIDPLYVEPDEECDEAENAPHGAPLNMLGGSSWRFLLALASAKHGIGKRSICSDSRNVEVVAARHYAMALIYQHTQNSMPQVAGFFGMNHTSILHALKKLNARRKLVDIHEWVEAKQRAKTSTMERQNG